MSSVIKRSEDARIRREEPKGKIRCHEVQSAYRQVGKFPHNDVRSWYRDIYNFYQNNEC